MEGEGQTSLRPHREKIEIPYTEGFPQNGFALVSGRGRSCCKGSHNLEVHNTLGSWFRNARCYPVEVVVVVVVVNDRRGNNHMKTSPYENRAN